MLSPDTTVTQPQWDIPLIPWTKMWLGPSQS